MNNRNLISKFELRLRQKLSYKNFIVIFKALSCCKKITNFIFSNMTEESLSLKTPTNYYNVFSYQKKLISLILQGEIFLHHHNLEYIKEMNLLEKIHISNSTFKSLAFKSTIESISYLKNLKELKIFNNNIDRTNFNGNNKKNFSSIFLENLKIENFNIGLLLDFSQTDFCPVFLNYIVNSKTIKELKIWISDNFDNYDIKLFVKYIKNSKILLKLHLFMNEECDWDYFFKNLLKNKSILFLDFSGCGLSSKEAGIINFLTCNQRIKYLNLTDCDLCIDEKFVNSLKANSTLNSIIFDGNKINKKIIPELFKLNIKEISLQRTNVTNEEIDLYKGNNK